MGNRRNLKKEKQRRNQANAEKYKKVAAPRSKSSRPKSYPTDGVAKDSDSAPRPSYAQTNS